MVSLTWLNIDFIQTLEIVAEFGRILLALDFRPPPPEYTFRALEPLYKNTIEHFQARCEKTYAEITKNEAEKPAEGAVDDALDNSSKERQFDELEELLHRHSRLINSLSFLLQHPHLKPRNHSDEPTFFPDVDKQLGPERYIDTPFKGYGFSNDYIRQWLAAIPGRLGQRFEQEEAGKVNLTKMLGRVIIAIIGGASLLAPMIIMTTSVERIHPRLIVVSVATVLFGIAFALVSKSKENVLAGTAAYAAVMVVYIGSAS